MKPPVQKSVNYLDRRLILQLVHGGNLFVYTVPPWWRRCSNFDALYVTHPVPGDIVPPDGI